MPAYITAMGRFLPGEPVPNDEIEDYIGTVGRGSTALREKILASSGIKTRHYAIDKKQESVYSSRHMAAEAVLHAIERSEIGLDDLQMLAAASTIPDLIAPSLASMVHGELGCPPCEILSTHGICNSGMMALKGAYHQVAAGEKRNAAVVACEFASRASKSSHFASIGAAADDRSIALEMAFLRYMLSDGAGSALLQDRPAAQGVSLRIDWITLTSYANTEKACMYFGSNSNTADKCWLDYSSTQEALAAGALAPRQDLALLPHLVKVGLDEYQRLLDQGRFDPDSLRWLPVHYSSERMKKLVLTEATRRGIHRPPTDHWFSNLTKVGNIGSASIYVILEELLTEGLISPGDTLLCMVPESGRFSVAFMHLTAVSGTSGRM